MNFELTAANLKFTHNETEIQEEKGGKKHHQQKNPKKPKETPQSILTIEKIDSKAQSSFYYWRYNTGDTVWDSPCKITNDQHKNDSPNYSYSKI